MNNVASNNVKRWLYCVWTAIMVNNTDFFNGDNEKIKKFQRELAILALSVIHKESGGKQDLLNKQTKDKNKAAFGLTQQKPKFFAKLWGNEKYNPEKHILIYINTMLGFYKKTGSLLTSAFCWAGGEGAVKEWIKNGDEAFKKYDYLDRQSDYMKDLFINIYPLYFDFVLSWLEQGRPTFSEIVTSKKYLEDSFKNSFSVTMADYSIKVDIFKFFSPWVEADGIFVWRGVGQRAITTGAGAGRSEPRVSVWRGAAFLLIPIGGIFLYKWKQGKL